MQYLVYLVKHQVSIGVILYEDMKSISNVFNNVSDMLKNYNKKLISEDLPNEVLAHRFLEKTDVDLSDFLKGTRDAGKILGISYNYLKDKYRSYLWYDIDIQDSKNGLMAFVPMDILNLMSPVGIRRVQIDLDKKTIGFYDFFGKFSKEEYCKRLKIDEDEFNKMNIPIANVEEFSFNEYEDVVNFIRTHLIWKEPILGLICQR